MDFAARSVICPDMYIGTNEIGIPMVRTNKGVFLFGFFLGTEPHCNTFSYVTSGLKHREFLTHLEVVLPSVSQLCVTGVC